MKLPGYYIFISRDETDALVMEWLLIIDFLEFV
jgi:hypothetical protein